MERILGSAQTGARKVIAILQASGPVGKSREADEIP
jgi:hypothetical protein